MMRNTGSAEAVHVCGRVLTTLTDAITGRKRTFHTHNIALDYQFEALANALAGAAFTAPSQIVYGSGTGTPQVTDAACFATIAGSLTKMAYATANSPANGTVTLIFQTAAGVISSAVTEAYLQDENQRGFAHSLFPSAFTPASTETITTKWELTYSAS